MGSQDSRSGGRESLRPEGQAKPPAVAAWLLGCGARREQALLMMQMLTAAGATVWGCGGGTRVFGEGRRPSGTLKADV